MSMGIAATEVAPNSTEKTAVTAPESTNRPSLRAAINAMCRECIYDRLQPGNWRQQVTACTAPNCPLYPVRPRSSS